VKAAQGRDRSQMKLAFLSQNFYRHRHSQKCFEWKEIEENFHRGILTQTSLPSVPDWMSFLNESIPVSYDNLISENVPCLKTFIKLKLKQFSNKDFL